MDLARARYKREQELEASGRKRASWAPSHREWGMAEELLSSILDRVGELLSVEASHPLPKGTKAHKPPKRFPRPVSAYERVKLEARLEYMESIVSDVEEAQARYRQMQADGLLPPDQ